MTDARSDLSRPASIALWVLRGLLAAFFLFFASMKLSSQPFMVTEFAAVGLGQWFRYFTGALEVIGGIAILIPRVSVIGAVVLLIVDLGALATTILVLPQGDWVHIVVVALLLATVIYLQRPGRTPFHA